MISSRKSRFTTTTLRQLLETLPRLNRFSRHQFILSISNVQLTIGVITGSDASDPDRRILLISGQHGGEWIGPQAVADLWHDISPHDVDGQIIMIPYANPLALHAQQRNNPLDNFDMNRSYPGNPQGFITEKLAHVIFQVALRSQYIIDCHSPSFGAQYLPHVIFVEDVKLLPYLSYFGVQWAFLITQLPGALSYECMRRDKISFVLESGDGVITSGKPVVQYKQILKHFLSAIKILSHERYHRVQPRITWKKQKVESGMAARVAWKKPLGYQFKKGEVLGSLRQIGSFTDAPIPAPDSGILFYQRMNHVLPRQTIYHYHQEVPKQYIRTTSIRLPPTEEEP